MQCALIFDLDGTLVESLPALANSLNRALDAYQLPTHSHAEIRHMIGNGLKSLVSRAAPADASPALLEDLQTFFTNDYRRTWHTGTTPFDGIVRLLSTLSEAGFYLGVLSNKPHEFTKEIVLHLFPDIPFSQVLGHKPNALHKPDPAGALEIAQNCSLSAAQCVIIGDSSVDVQTAHHAGMQSIAVTWGYHDLDRLEAAKPNHLVHSPAEIIPLILSHYRN